MPECIQASATAVLPSVQISPVHVVTPRLLADVDGAPHSRNAIPTVEAAASESHTRLAPDVDGAAPGQSVAVSE